MNLSSQLMRDNNEILALLSILILKIKLMKNNHTKKKINKKILN
jgi:hypothetical protein